MRCNWMINFDYLQSLDSRLKSGGFGDFFFFIRHLFIWKSPNEALIQGSSGLKAKPFGHVLVEEETRALRGNLCHKKKALFCAYAFTVNMS